MAVAVADPVDLEEVFLRYAEQMFQETKTGDQKRIPKDALQYRINYKRTKFDHKDPEFTDRDKPAKPSSQVLFKTCFSNRTGYDQEYSFRTQRTTTSTCDVSIEQAYTVGYEMNLSIKTPCEIVEANAGFHREFSVTNAHGQSIEEQLSWEVDSQIKVPSGHRTSAELVVSEDQFSGKFNLVTEISGKVMINITNMNNNNALVKVVEGEVVAILNGMKSQFKGLKLFDLDDRRKTARFVTRGCCQFHFAIEQHVKLREEKLTEEEE